MDWASHLRPVVTVLGEDVTYIDYTGSSATVRGVFSSAYQAADLGSVGVAGSGPSFAAMTADLPRADTRATLRRTEGNTLVIYKVRAVHPDDPSGFTVLELRKS